MFRLKFYPNTSNSMVEAIEIVDDGSFTQIDIKEFKTALEKLQIQNTAVTFARKHKNQEYARLGDGLLTDYAYIAEILSDCWQYPDEPLRENGKPDIRPYIGIIHLLQNVINLALQSRRRLDEYREVFGDLPSDIFNET
ncbi:hypothetical protein [Butyrivibrio sp. INlla14]|uniref:hypothetical protein n=1 Tax=Butyrivibrio sp. INlla14 TaxID=1520808 RepID=UPI0008773F1D|nr:hypothetical protein [Butyrivibrio sp. INlla14]SCY68892.1 hypothetical protein SAMN02910371_03391 [Butyrivibrio sp. INlla14]